MANAAVPDAGARLYLDDLQVGRRFTSGTHALDEAQIKAFAAQFDPQAFHLDDEASRGSLFGGLVARGWHTAAITMRLNVGGGLPLAGGIVGRSGEISWPRPHIPVTSCTSKARSWKSRRRARGRTAERPRCAARPATSEARSCRWRR